MAELISRELIAQFEETWRMLREIVANTPDDQWRVGCDDYLIPTRLVYHVVFTADLYATQLSYEAYKTRRTYRLNWEDSPPQDLPSREQILEWMSNTQGKVRDWIETLGDAGLLAEQSDYDWTGQTHLGRAIYVLRHSQNHIGEINAELHRRALPGGEW